MATDCRCQNASSNLRSPTICWRRWDCSVSEWICSTPRRRRCCDRERTMKAGEHSQSGAPERVDIAEFLGPPKLLGRDDKLATLAIKVNEGNPHLRIIDQKV